MPSPHPDRQYFRIEVTVKPHLEDAPGKCARTDLMEAGLDGVESARSVSGFSLSLSGGLEAARRIAESVLADPVMNDFSILENTESPPVGADSDHRIDVVKRAGVMDPAADGVVRAVRAAGEEIFAVRTYSAWLIRGTAEAAALREVAARTLGNEAIEEIYVDDPSPVFAESNATETPFEIREVALPDDDESLEKVSVDGGLSLTIEEMSTIRQHFRELERAPTDVELETLAQTWSEHCKHKTLTASVNVDGRAYENLLKDTIFAATRELDLPWCISVFVDNAGVIAFDDDYHITFKVETHNHPSAIEPYGGAGTGIGGVLRDTMGTGLGARPIVSTDVFCVGPPDMAPEDVPAGSLHPKRVLKGIVAGVRDYGNRMGIPTGNGTVLFDERYTANPLVFCGSVGILPVNCVEKDARDGDLIVVVGGRTGRDGIHGATFSSRELHSESETVDSGAVQIGNAITEKRVLDALMIARDRGLFSCLTDCGAGGLSSAVGEMAEGHGADVNLDLVPLKYDGLTYDEIWISEAQERMVLAVPPEHEKEVLDVFRSEDVEASVIGTFNDSGRLILRFQNSVVGDMDLDFLHNGVPDTARHATAVVREGGDPDIPVPDNFGKVLHSLLSNPNIASKEWIIHQYDHEVQAGTVVKPFVGEGQKTPADAAVIRPRLDSDRGIAIGCGINPAYGDIDPYAMGLLAVDEAVRNVVAVGGRSDRIALLDNFCAGNCDRPEILWEVARVAEACRDASLALKAPFISGKDSLNNEYRTEDGTAAIPTTILISSVSLIDDVRKAMTSNLKQEGSQLLQIGVTRPEMGGSAFFASQGVVGASVPQVDLDQTPRLFAKVEKLISDGLLLACHDLSEGGLAVAAAEMTFGSRVGLKLDLSGLGESTAADGESRDNRTLLFSESPTRFIVEVATNCVDRVLAELAETSHAIIGETTKEQRLYVTGLGGETIIDETVSDLHVSFRSGLDLDSSPDLEESS